MTWGIESHITERFGKAGIAKENITFSKTPWTFRASYSSSEFVLVFKNFYGPTMNAFEAAEKNGKSAEMQKELEQLFASQNKSLSANTTEITAMYLLVTVHCN